MDEHKNQKELFDIEFIERKRKPPIFEKIRNDLFIFMIKMNYENGNLLFKILYDKIYRNSLYKYILNSDINVPNKTRTFLSFNKDNFHYKFLKKNEEFIIENDEDIYSENLYLQKTHEIFRYSIINKYSSFIFVIILFGGLLFQKKSLSIFSSIGLLSNIVLYIKIGSRQSELIKLQKTSFSKYQDLLVFGLYKTIYNQL